MGRLHDYTDGSKLRWWRSIKDCFAKRNGGLELAKGVSYDTVGVAKPFVLAALHRLVEPEQTTRSD